MKKSIVIFDTQEEFADRLMSFMENNTDYNVRIFTRLEKFDEYVYENTKEYYLLIDCEYSRKIITKLGLKALLITDDANLEKTGICNCVYRYRSAEDMIEVIDAKITRQEEPMENSQKEFKMFSFVSPVHILDVDNILLELALSSVDKTLIIDMRFECIWNEKGVDTNIQKKHNTSLSDIFYMIKEGKQNLYSYIEKAICNFEQVDLLYGIKTPRDIFEIDMKDIDTLLTTILSEKLYDTVYIAFPREIMDIMNVSTLAHSIVLISRGTVKEEHLIENIMSEGYEFMKHINLSEGIEELEMEAERYIQTRREESVIWKAVGEFVTNKHR